MTIQQKLTLAQQFDNFSWSATEPVSWALYALQLVRHPRRWLDVEFVAVEPPVAVARMLWSYGIPTTLHRVRWELAPGGAVRRCRLRVPWKQHGWAEHLIRTYQAGGPMPRAWRVPARVQGMEMRLLQLMGGSHATSE